MKVGIILALVCTIKYSNGVTIDPGSSEPGISAQLTTDPRGINKINTDNQWEIFQSFNNRLNDWYENNYQYIENPPFNYCT